MERGLYMYRKRLSALIALLLVLAISCFAVAEDITYESRGVQVPATVVLPEGDGPFPLVVLAHGHGGSRDENIGFGAIADVLQAKGIASIRMDFPGCGESTESFQLNTLTNMKQDVLSAVSYATENYPIDASKVGIFGYSMGGRIALSLLAEDAYDFAAAAFLAPANSTDDLKNLFGGMEAWDIMKDDAETNGLTFFETIYGQTQELSTAWFTDLEANDNPAQVAAEKFDGPSLVIYAADDEAVSPSVSEAVAQAMSAEMIDATGDGHSYGFYSDKTEVLDTVANGTADFFAGAFAN